MLRLQVTLELFGSTDVRIRIDIVNLPFRKTNVFHGNNIMNTWYSQK